MPRSCVSFIEARHEFACPKPNTETITIDDTDECEPLENSLLRGASPPPDCRPWPDLCNAPTCRRNRSGCCTLTATGFARPPIGHTCWRRWRNPKRRPNSPPSRHIQLRPAQAASRADALQHRQGAGRGGVPGYADFDPARLVTMAKAAIDYQSTLISST